MNLDAIKQVYLIGIGGIGMSGLARYFKHLGCEVNGYDRTETELTKTLVKEGIAISYQDDINTIDAIFHVPTAETLVIFTPAIPKDSKIKAFLESQGHILYKRSQVLGIISESRFTVAVAGTHGKTTTSTMVAHVLKDSGYDCSAFLGGISSNYGTNVLYGNNNTVVVEADEFDRSFLTLHPNIAIVTSSDADHLDIYSGHEIADAYASNVHVRDGEFFFDYQDTNGRIDDIHLGIPGTHNVENAVAAIAVARLLGIENEAIKKALTTFKGVKRRFEYIVRKPGTVYIDDYAHHPEELRAFLTSMRKLYPTKKLNVVFQPHLFSRTRDFVDGFAEVLSMADNLLLMEIYPARELPIEGINSSWLLDKITAEKKQLVTAEEVLEFARDEKPELIVTVGAGDIDKLVKPLQEILGHA